MGLLPTLWQPFGKKDKAVRLPPRVILKDVSPSSEEGSALIKETQKYAALWYQKANHYLSLGVPSGAMKTTLANGVVASIHRVMGDDIVTLEFGGVSSPLARRWTVDLVIGYEEVYRITVFATDTAPKLYYSFGETRCVATALLRFSSAGVTLVPIDEILNTYPALQAQGAIYFQPKGSYCPEFNIAYCAGNFDSGYSNAIPARTFPASPTGWNYYATLIPSATMQGIICREMDSGYYAMEAYVSPRGYVGELLHGAWYDVNWMHSYAKVTTISGDSLGTSVSHVSPGGIGGSWPFIPNVVTTDIPFKWGGHRAVGRYHADKFEYTYTDGPNPGTSPQPFIHATFEIGSRDDGYLLTTYSSDSVDSSLVSIPFTAVVHDPDYGDIVFTGESSGAGVLFQGLFDIRCEQIGFLVEKVYRVSQATRYNLITVHPNTHAWVMAYTLSEYEEPSLSYPEGRYLPTNGVFALGARGYSGGIVYHDVILDPSITLALDQLGEIYHIGGREVVFYLSPKSQARDTGLVIYFDGYTYSDISHILSDYVMPDGVQYPTYRYYIGLFAHNNA